MMNFGIFRSVGKFVMVAFVAVAISTATTGCSQKRCGNCPSKCSKPCDKPCDKQGDKQATSPCGPGCTKPCCKKA